METKPNYSDQASTLLANIANSLYPHLPFSGEINYIPCTVEVINDDFGTIMVQWGQYHHKMQDIPITALATIADNILL